MSDEEGHYFRITVQMSITNCKSSQIIGPIPKEKLGGDWGEDMPPMSYIRDVVWEEIEAYPEKVDPEEAREERGF